MKIYDVMKMSEINEIMMINRKHFYRCCWDFQKRFSHGDTFDHHLEILYRDQVSLQEHY